MLFNLFIVLLTVVAMEVFSVVAHKHIMHGFGWNWHKSHHEPHPEGRTFWLEKNDLYAVFFAGVAIALIWFGTEGRHPLEWIGAGMTVYGFLYFVAHDGLVHRRWPFKYVPKRGYLKRLYQAHLMHHAVESKEGAVSFGFLYSPPVAQVKQRLRDLHQGPLAGRGRGASTAQPDEQAPS